MKIISCLSRVPILLASLFLAGVPARGQTYFTNLYSFSTTASPAVFSPGGTMPVEPIFGSPLDGTMYGFAYNIASPTGGGIFEIYLDGSGFNPLQSFPGLNEPAQLDPTTIISFPYDAGLQLGVGGMALSSDGSELYGIYPSDENGNGAVFQMDSDGGNYTNIFTFTNYVDGYVPSGNLALSPDGTALYGTAEKGGTNGTGLVFKVSTADGSFTDLYSFATNVPTPPLGAYPFGVALTSDGAVLYGTTANGGTYGVGALYALSTSGTTPPHIVYNFGDPTAFSSYPIGNLTLSNGVLYGATGGGGIGNPQTPNIQNGDGIIFAVATNGTGFTNLHSLLPQDGGCVVGPLLLSGNTLYGVCTVGGTNNTGTVFELNVDGTGFFVLHTFSALDSNGLNSDGAYPSSALVASGPSLFGTTLAGGPNGGGTMFQIAPAPVAHIHVIPGGVQIGWADGLSKYVVQSSSSFNFGIINPSNLIFPTNVNDETRYVSIPVLPNGGFFRLVTAPGPPTVTTTGYGSLATNGATLDGTVNPNGADTAVWFEYGTNTGYGQNTPVAPVTKTDNLTTVPVSWPLTGLQAGMTYYFQLVGTNQYGTNYGGQLSFTTPIIPVVTTLPPTSVGATTVTLNGSINGEGTSVAGYFEYDLGSGGSTYTYNTRNNQYLGPANMLTQSFSNTLTGLRAGTQYHYRAVGFNLSSEGAGVDTNFTTAPLPPPTLVSPGASLPAGPYVTTLTPTFTWITNGAADYTLLWIENPSGANSGTAGNLTGSFAAPVTLQPGTNYYWYMIAFDSFGDQSGPSQTNYFQTPAPPTAITEGVTNISESSAQFLGYVNPNGLATSVFFQYDKGSGTDYGISTIPASPDPSPGTTPQSYNQTLPGLTAASAYHFRFVATNSLGTNYGATVQFETSP